MFSLDVPENIFPHSARGLAALLIVCLFSYKRNLCKIKQFLIAGSSIPVYTPADNLTLADLVPDLAETHAPFYTYKGSLTTPPCYESVQWIVMKNQVTVTKDQVMLATP